MLSRHPESCRFPHGHTRTIEVVVSSDHLDENGMVVDFKALSLAVREYVERYDHALAVNSSDPALPALQRLYPDQAFVVLDGEPTTEAIARDIFEYVAIVLDQGFESETYRIPAGRLSLEKVKVWETPSSWAEYGQ